MTSLLDLIKCRLQVRVPRVKSLIGKLLPLIDCHNTCQAVNLGPNPSIDNHIAKLVFRSLNRDTNKLTHPRQGNATVVALNHTQVMLNKLPNQLDQVVLAVHGLVLEWLKRGHLLRDVILLQRHQLEGEELSDVLGQ